MTVLAKKQVGLVTGAADTYHVSPIEWSATANPSVSQIVSNFHE
jgi:hypothetical protein